VSMPLGKKAIDFAHQKVGGTLVEIVVRTENPGA